MKTHYESKRSFDYVKEAEWYRYELDTLCEKLNTDKEKGLSGEVLEKKTATNPKNDIFDADSGTRSNVPKTVWPVLAGLLVILLLVSGFALKDGTAWLAILLTVLGYAFSYVLLVLSMKAAALLEEFSIPRVTAVRGGEPVRISQRDVVQGDVLLLSAGDIVPCDGRIVYQDDLFVLEKNISGGNGRKDAEFIDKTVGLESFNQVNMVFARSAVSTGSCRIIACDIGGFTLCMRRGIKSAKGKSGELSLFKKTARISRIYSVCCSAVVFAVTLLSFLLHDNAAVFSAFLLTLSIAVSSFCELIGSLSYAAVVLGVYPGEDKSEKTGAIIKNLSAVERMRDMTHLFIPKNSGICQNRIETELIFTNERELYPETDNADKLRRVVYTAVSTFGGRERHAKKQTAQTYEQDAFTVTAEKLGISIDQIESSMIPLQLCHADGERFFETSLVYYKEQYMICVRGSAVQIVSRCTSKLSNGSPVPLSDDGRNDLITRAKEYENLAYRVTAVASKISRFNNLDKKEYCQSDLCFEGFFVMREPYSDHSADAVSTLSSMGITTVMFCDDMAMQSVNLAKNIGICRDETQKLTSPEFVASNINIIKLKMLSYRLFCGLNHKQKKYVKDCFLYKGAKLGVVGGHLYDISLMSDEQTVAFSVTSAVNSKKAKIDENGFYISETSEALKRASDVIIGSADKKGRGGVNAVLRAVLTSRKIFNNIYNSLIYLAVSNTLRFILAAVSVFSGLFTLTPAQMLFSGMFLDLFAVISIFLSDNREMSVSEDLMKKAEKKRLRPVVTALTYLTVSVVSVFIPAITAALCGLGAAESGIVCFSALLFTQLALCRSLARGKYSFRAGLTGLFLIIVLAVTEYLALSAVFSRFFDAYMTGNTGFAGIFLCLIAPAVFIAAVRLVRLFGRKRK